MTRERDLEAARQLSERGEYDNAYVIADRYLKGTPDDAAFLTIMVYCLLGSEKAVVAYHLAKRVTQLQPNEPSGWMNLGMAANDLWLDSDAIRYYKRGLKLADKKTQKSMFCVNLSSVLVDMGRFEEAEKYCNQALQLNPESVKAKANLGFCQLAQRNWKEGWKNYRQCWGSEWRPRISYNDEPEWTGTEKGVILVSGEQGLGDEISFASMLPDMEKWADENDSSVILECEPRLEKLFQRSFPNIEVHGTRRTKQVTWDVSRIDYSIPAGQLGEYFRLTDGAFQSEAYLKPDENRVLQWRALFESKSKPVIGLAWRGGTPKTAAKYRQWELEQLLPLLKSVDAHWVSLQYRPADKEIAAFKERHPEIDIVEYRHGTLTNDYDDTVAMIAAMDQVVCMQTAVTHVAGALGVPCWTFIPETSQWRYGQGSEEFIWADSVRLIRQNKRGYWDDVIKETAKELHENFAGVPEAAGSDAHEPGPGLRDNGGAVRGDGGDHHRLNGSGLTA